MDSFFTNLREQVSIHQTHTDSDSEEEHCSSSDVLNSALPSDTCTFSQTVDEDEYVVIESVGNKFTRYRGSVSSEQYPDSPPTYRQVSQTDELPSYLSVLSGSCTIISGPAMFSKHCLSPLESDERFPMRNLKSAVSDVPFRLHPSLEMQSHTQAIFDHLNLEPLSFDWSKHSHDFRNENLCLRDMNSDEIANIDEFLIRSSSHQSPTLSSKDSEINLIQL
ncbi:hypothetical protein BsWGS_00632 [Bradybaena similaris]